MSKPETTEFTRPKGNPSTADPNATTWSAREADALILVAKCIDWMQRAVDAEETLRDVHGALDAILRGQHLGWDRALSAARERCRVALESCNG